MAFINFPITVIIVSKEKGKSTELCIGFSKLYFHHLMDLKKLKDLQVSTKNRAAVFDDILAQKTTYGTISKSRYIHLVENRFQFFAHIESLLDENRLVFRYNAKPNPFSQIEADNLMSTPYMETDTYIFLEVYTMLYKVKSIYRQGDTGSVRPPHPKTCLKNKYCTKHMFLFPFLW